MGTRNLTMVYSAGEYKLAQYGQWDGYPSSSGVKILNFLKRITQTNSDVVEALRTESNSLEEFTRKVNSLQQITEEEHRQSWVNCGADADASMVTMDVANRHAKEYPHLSRDLGADILEHVLNSAEGLRIDRRLPFAADSLFCEWAYVVDLDKQTFEVYKGFNLHPLTPDERFYFLQDVVKDESPTGEYYPVSHVKTYAFAELPTDEQLCEECDSEEE